MYVHRDDTIVRVALIPQLRWIQLLTLLHVWLLHVLQIRQEKPYYIADPEVDSLVSISLVYSSVSETSVSRYHSSAAYNAVRCSACSDASNHSVSLLGDHCKIHANSNARIAKHASLVSLRHRQLIMGAIRAMRKGCFERADRKTVLSDLAV